MIYLLTNCICVGVPPHPRAEAVLKTFVILLFNYTRFKSMLHVHVSQSFVVDVMNGYLNILRHLFNTFMNKFY